MEVNEQQAFAVLPTRVKVFPSYSKMLMTTCLHWCSYCCNSLFQQFFFSIPKYWN